MTDTLTPKTGETGQLSAHALGQQIMQGTCENAQNWRLACVERANGIKDSLASSRQVIERLEAQGVRLGW